MFYLLTSASYPDGPADTQMICDESTTLRIISDVFHITEGLSEEVANFRAHELLILIAKKPHTIQRKIDGRCLCIQEHEAHNKTLH